MNSDIVRALVALVLAGLLWMQVRSAASQPHRQRAYKLAAGAMVAFAGYNGVLAAGLAAGPLQLALVLVGVALIVLAGAELARSYFSGELRAQRDQINAAAREYRERRTGMPDADATHDSRQTRDDG